MTLIKTRNILLISIAALCFTFLVTSAAPVEEKNGSEDDELPEDKSRRSKLVAFLVSFFVGRFGVDWFYLSRGDVVYIVVGVVKFFLIGSAGVCRGKGQWVVRVGIFIWWVVDWARILANFFPDGKGNSLIDDL